MAKAYRKRALGRGLSAILSDEDNNRFTKSASLNFDEIEIDFTLRQKPVRGNSLSVYIEDASIDIELDYQNTKDIKKAYCTLGLIYTNS